MANRNEGEEPSSRSITSQHSPIISSTIMRSIIHLNEPLRPDQQPITKPTLWQILHGYSITIPFFPSPWTSRDDLGGFGIFPTCNTLLSTYERRYGEVSCMAAGSDGLLYTGSCSKNIRVWKKGHPYGGFNDYEGPHYAILLGPEDHVFATSYDGRIRVWVKEATEETEQPLYKHISSLPIIKERLKEWFWRKKMRLERKFEQLYWHSFPTTCICLSEDKRYLYSGSTDHCMKIWRLEDWKFIEAKLEHKLGVSAVAAGCDCLVFSGSMDGSLIMWKRNEDRERKKPTHTRVQYLLTEESPVDALLLKSTDEAESGELYAGLWDGRVLVWKERSHWSSYEVLSFHQAAVTCLARSPGPLVFSGSADGRICAWRRESYSGHTLVTVIGAHQGPVNCIAAVEDWEENDEGPSRCILYSGGTDKRLKTWRIAECTVDPMQCGR
ncbi:hypothetical protein LUZ63_004104 [Rhynchospora breviuscula]|uniref:Uncharacterized protein n=1 Tax=Rhynchospora breviuscula TaxID=2022672 RepID=A0A9Q0I016_9POAL|nr:hypothetical protein LUZ63_004104 [Rhynchospora breviuscula]